MSDVARKESANRASQLARTRLEVEVYDDEDSIKVLEKLCSLGRYGHKLHWDKFANGTMATCEIFYELNGRRRMIIQRARFYRKGGVEEAKRKIARDVVQRLNIPIERKRKGEHRRRLIPTSIRDGRSYSGVLRSKQTKKEPEKEKEREKERDYQAGRDTPPEHRLSPPSFPESELGRPWGDLMLGIEAEDD